MTFSPYWCSRAHALKSADNYHGHLIDSQGKLNAVETAFLKIKIVFSRMFVMQFTIYVHAAYELKNYLRDITKFLEIR